MIGVTKPPYTCKRCGISRSTLTGISQHELTCRAPRDFRQGRAPSGPRPVDAIGRAVPLRPVKKLKTSTAGKLIHHAPFCPLDASPKLLHERERPAKPVPPSMTEHPGEKPRRPRITWFDLRVRFYMKLIAMRNAAEARLEKDKARG